MLKLQDIDLQGKKVLLRTDINVPLVFDKIPARISSEARLISALPTIKYILSQCASLLIVSHLGRPKEGMFDEKLSLSPVAQRLSQLLDRDVHLVRDWQDPNFARAPLQMLENIRFAVGEKSNDSALANYLASLADVYVMDAFATAHRSHASTVGALAKSAIAVAGLQLLQEIEALDQVKHHSNKPLVAIVGGAKIAGKLELLEALSQRVDVLIVGGGIANTFLKAADQPIGASLYEPQLLPLARSIAKRCDIPLPQDALVVNDLNNNEYAETKLISEINADDIIGDIGAVTVQNYADIIGKANTIVWNGPLGIFEDERFSAGTFAIAKAVANSSGYTLAGGGDTIAALEQCGLEQELSYISTAGGAFLEYMADKPLPAIEALRACV